MERLRRIVFDVLVVVIIFSIGFSSSAENSLNTTELDEEIISSKVLEKLSSLSNDKNVEDIYETIKEKTFFEETRAGLSINEYEKEELQKLLKEESAFVEEAESREARNVLESVAADIVFEKIESSERGTVDSTDVEDIASTSELKEIGDNHLVRELYSSGDHPSTASPSVVINSTYDRYEIYTGENA